MPSRLTLLFIFLFTAHSVVRTQPASSPFITRTFTAQDGLPHSYVYASRQDNKGYLWIGTRYGLGRFDGTRFTTIPLHPAGVSNILISYIHEDEKGKIWFYAGSSLYYTEGSSFRLYQNRESFPLALAFRENQFTASELWAVEDHKMTRVDHYSGVKTIPIKPIGNEYCRRIAFAKNGIYLCLMGNILFQKNDGTTDTLGKQLPPYRFIVIAGISNGKLFFYTNRGVYHYFEGKIQTLFEKELQGKHVYAAYRDSKNRIWVATQQNGVQVSLPGEETTLAWSVPNTHKLVSGFAEDREGNIWIASFEGLTKAREKMFIPYTKNDLASLDDLNNIAFQKGRFYTFSESTGMTKWEQGKFSQPAAGSRNRFLVDIYCRDERDRLWCITRQNRLFILENEKAYFLEDPVLKASYDLEWHICYDSLRKKIWIPGDQLYIGDEKGFQVFKDKEGQPISNPKGFLGLGEGRLLVFTKKGELILIGKDNSTRLVKTPASIKPESIYRLFRDQAGHIIVSYPGNGLMQCKLSGTDSIILKKVFNTENGLANDFVQSFLQDKKGRYWLSTMAGLTIIDNPHLNSRFIKIYNLGVDEGIPAGGLEYGRLLQDTGDVIWYGTQYALMRFSDSIPLTSRSGPVVSIEQVMLNNRVTNWRSYTDSLSGIFQVPFNPVLRHSENSITISFNAATLKDKKNVQYRYLLSNGNPKEEFWSSPTAGSTISFSRLKPSDYRFFVMAGTNRQDWGSPAIFSFTILEPFWQKSWFIGACIFLGFSLLYMFYRFRLSQLKKEARIRNQIARDLHDDLGSTLNSVKVYANIASLEPGNPEPIEKIMEGTQDAISGVRDLVWVLDEKKDTLEHLFSRISQYAGPLCEANHIRYSQSLEDGLYAYLLNREEKRNLYLIIKEVINNSIKYAGCKNITLTAEAVRKKPRLTISDDGCGFDTEKVLKGNGLDNIIARAKEIHFDTEFRSSPGEGTTLLMEKK